MREALAISPEKLAFIQRGAAAGTPETSSPVPSPVVGVSNSKPTETGQDEAPPLRERRPAYEDVGRRDERHAPPVEQPLVPLTTRLRAETADALRRAHLEQRLRRQPPDTVQEIVEAGVAQILRAMGYLH